MKKINYALEQRLNFIDRELCKQGNINRRILTSRFRISRATATRDFKIYKDLAPKNMIYNPGEKHYCRTETFKSVYKIE